MKISDGNKLLVSPEQINGLKETYQAIFQQSMVSQASPADFNSERQTQTQEVVTAAPQSFEQAGIQDSSSNIFDAPLKDKSEQSIAFSNQGQNLEGNIFNASAPSAVGLIDDMNANQVQNQLNNGMPPIESATIQISEEGLNKTLEERLAETRRKRDDALFRATIAIEDANGFTAEVDRLEEELKNNGKAVAPVQTEQVNTRATFGM